MSGKKGAGTKDAHPLILPPHARRPPLPTAEPLLPQPDCDEKKCVALTFDDGPGPYTGKLLDMLAEHDAKATFFLIGGNIAGREKLVRREVEDGHAVGDHTWSHPQLTAMSNSAIRSQIKRTMKAIEKASGKKPTMLRPPYGATNGRVHRIARKLGLAEILWSVDTDDWRDRDSTIVAHRAITRARRGSIILVHDIHPTTVEAVPEIISGLRDRGFTLVTVPELYADPMKPDDDPLKPGKVYFAGPHNPLSS